MEKKVEGIYDGFKELGTGKMLILGFQHVFAMFGATVLVPLLTGLSVSVTLFCAGIGTIWFYIITKRKIPIFLGSSFAFIGAFNSIANGGDKELLPYATLGVVCAGLIYVVLAILFAIFGAKKVMRFFPPIVTGPIIILIGLNLSGTAISNASTCWWLALVAIAIIIVANIWGKGMIKIIPILLGVIGSYVIAVIADPAVRANLVQNVSDAKWFALPIHMERTVFGLFGRDDLDGHMLLTAAVTIVPLSLATMVEHIGDVSAISSTCNRNYIENPGLHRTLVGDGLATTMAALFGAPANTTYGENTGVLALSKVYDPRVIRLAALYAIILSFSPKFDALVNSIPTAIVGGVSFVLYGMISAVGVRNVVENKVDLTKSRNLIIAAVIFVSGLGFSSTGGITFTVGSADITLTGLAIAALAGVILNAILPGNDYEFGKSVEGDASADLGSY